MKIYNKLILTSLISFFFSSSIIAQTFNGYVLYNNMGSYTSYLIDKNGTIAKSWSCNLEGNYSVKLKNNGNIVRGGYNTNNVLSAPAVSGVIQEIDPSGNIVWEFEYSNSTHVSHHDFTILPNGNVILMAYEVKNISELTQAGYNDLFGFGNDLWPTHFIEVQQNGTGGQIVWEWHIWDHLIQDYNATKDNYGIVANNPQLMDINAVAPQFGGFGGGDWFHVNGIDYNPTLDQLVFTSRYASEFFIIDHSTTTAEAASHTGGNAGMGGDFLYRWGNPSNYGSTSPQVIPAAVHDPRWIIAGRPDEGYIQFFNNEGISGNTSTVEAINPPLSGYNYTGFGPSSYDWRHTCFVNSTGQSAHDRMTNGNTFVNVSGEYMYEVDSLNNMVWQYNAGPAKAFRYECDHPGIIALLGVNPCGLTGVEEISSVNINVYPNPSTGVFSIVGMPYYVKSFGITAYDIYGKKVLQSANDNSIDLSSFANGVYNIIISIEDRDILVKKVSLIK
jgi:hypothetical protein